MELGDEDGGRKGTLSRGSSLKVNRGAERISILKIWLGTVEFLCRAGLEISKGEWKYETFVGNFLLNSDGRQRRDRGCQNICRGDWPKAPSNSDATPQKHRSSPSEKRYPSKYFRGPWRERRGVQMADSIEIYLHLLGNFVVSQRAAAHNPDQSWQRELCNCSLTQGVPIATRNIKEKGQ